MKKIFFITTFIFVFGFALLPGFSFAQGMMGFPSSSSDNAAIQSQQQEEKEGKQFLDNLNNKTVVCSQLQDADFAKIGEYFMGQSIGDTPRHIAMNEMMKSMMGEQGEEQMHIVMGKRMSGCELNVPMSQNMMDGGMMGMMNMMGGGMMGGQVPQTNMMGNWGYFGYWNFLNILYVILLIGLIVLVYLWIVKLWKNMNNKGGRK